LIQELNRQLETRVKQLQINETRSDNASKKNLSLAVLGEANTAGHSHSRWYQRRRLSF